MLLLFIFLSIPVIPVRQSALADPRPDRGAGIQEYCDLVGNFQLN